MEGIKLISIERRRQIDIEGHTSTFDDGYANNELSMAAACYATPVQLYRLGVHGRGYHFIDPWPWRSEILGSSGEIIENYAWDKRIKHDYKRRLVIAGALIAAELDRIQRAEKT